MLHIIIKKMQSNKTLFICLIIGAILVTALICSIPLYSSGASTNILRRDLEQIKINTGAFPGEVLAEYPVSFEKSGGIPLDKVNSFEEKEIKAFKQRVGLPVILDKKSISTCNTDLYKLTKLDSKKNYIRLADKLWAIRDFEKHIKIVEGRMYRDESTDGSLEVILSKRAYSKLDITLGEEVALLQHGEWFGKGELPKKYIKVKLVGIYEMDNPADDYWRLSQLDYGKAIMVSYKVLTDEILKQYPNWLDKVYWQIGFDYKQIEFFQVKTIRTEFDQLRGQLFNRVRSSKVTATYDKALKNYEIKEAQLVFTIWILISPVMLMLILYICMVSQLIVIDDQNEISGLKSRGASKWDILKIYLWEIVIISGIALAIGPLLGLLICTMIGSSSGFLEFVGRKALPIKINSQILSYALVAQGIFFVTMIIPVLIYSRVGIVEHKQKAKKKKKIFWQRMWLDVVILLICTYWYYNYARNTQLIQGQSMDPLLYLVATLFIIGIGLLFIRIYPWCIKLVYIIGKNKWSPTAYATLNHLSRMKGSEQFIMLFMIMAIAIGIVNANEARTLNTNRDRNIWCNTGAEVVVSPLWKDFNVFFSVKDMQGNETSIKRPDYWIGGNEYEYEQLEQVESITKVMTEKPERIMVDENMIEVPSTVMGIEPRSFGQVAWVDSKILPVSINEYLNILIQKQNAAFVSSKIKEYSDVDIEVGDSLRITFRDSKDEYLGEMKVVICGFIDYWPSLANKVYMQGNNDKDPYKDNIMIVCNASYLTNSLGTLRYNIWLKKAPGITDQELLDTIEEKEIEYKNISFATSQMIESRTDGLNMGVNGMLTLGFIVIIAITLIGFIIYWMISIKGRALQFGILRAMGLKQKQVIIMLGLEQLMISGIAVLLGVVIGGITSDLFIPLLYKTVSNVTEVYPFSRFYARLDYYRIYAYIIIILMSGLSIVIKGIRKMKLSQVIKLGEE